LDQQNRTKILRRWSVPLLVDGRGARITGFTEWVPLHVGRGRRTGLPAAAPVAALALLVVVGSAVANQRRAKMAQ
jgi:hypothetical protein